MDIAEHLGAHKDMMHDDIFVGISSGSASYQAEATKEEQLEEVKYLVNKVTFQVC
jgi:hypothetical protein